MGSKSSSFMYSVDIPTKLQSPNQPQIRRNPMQANFLQSSPMSQTRNLRELYAQCFKIFGQRKCFGTIKYPSQSKPCIEFYNYQQVGCLAESIGRFLFCSNLPNEIEGRSPSFPKMRVIGLCSVGRIEWELTAIGCAMYGIVIVPIKQDLAIEEKIGIFSDCEIKTLFCSDEVAKEIMGHPQPIPKLTTLVTFNEALPTYPNPRCLTLLTYSNLQKQSQLLPPVAYPTISPKFCAMICYTCGTTGSPKGVMISHMNLMSSCANVRSSTDKSAIISDVHLSYVPIAHLFELVNILTFMSVGAHVIFSSGNLDNFKEEVNIVRPTFICGSSVLYAQIVDTIKESVGQLEGCAKKMVTTALDSKFKKVKKNGTFDHLLYDAIFFSHIRDTLGGRVRVFATGMGDLDCDLHSYFKVMFSAPLISVYGMVETTTISFITNSEDNITGHIGGPTANTEYKIVAVPELGWTDRDQKGRQRGEIVVRGPGVFIGYWKDEKRTQKVKDSEGWFYTGDLGVILAEKGALKFLGRKQYAFKLSTGKVIVPQKVEENLFKSYLMRELCVYGDSQHQKILAVIVPKQSLILQLAEEKDIQASFEDLCLNPCIIKAFYALLYMFCKSINLPADEIPKNIFLQSKKLADKRAFTKIGSLKRHQIKFIYKKEIEDMFSSQNLVVLNKNDLLLLPVQD